jgi:methionyl-tRNA formyltransferase
VRVIFLTSESYIQKLRAIINEEACNVEVLMITTKEELAAAASKNCRYDILLSFAHSMIVPESMLKSCNGKAVNFHAAPPEYPGRDPHHFAAYDNVSEYGATAHIMEAAVDSGKILDVERFVVETPPWPCKLLSEAESASYSQMRRIIPQLFKGKWDWPEVAKWGSSKKSRKDFNDLCTVDPNIGPAELERRYRATYVPGRRNLRVVIGEYSFRIEQD